MTPGERFARLFSSARLGAHEGSHSLTMAYAHEIAERSSGLFDRVIKPEFLSFNQHK